MMCKLDINLRLPWFAWWADVELVKRGRGGHYLMRKKNNAYMWSTWDMREASAEWVPTCSQQIIIIIIRIAPSTLLLCGGGRVNEAWMKLMRKCNMGTIYAACTASHHNTHFLPHRTPLLLIINLAFISTHYYILVMTISPEPCTLDYILPKYFHNAVQ